MRRRALNPALAFLPGITPLKEGDTHTHTRAGILVHKAEDGGKALQAHPPNIASPSPEQLKHQKPTHEPR